ncbi:MAG: hypothetical protein Q4A31_03095 [Corynebacterium sp.]|uniref:hypothetical protein n=1 Tax=Corynebacterium sp. TaxID=1720 RepID=UPI0026DD5C9F|nr:hypothetical protein [Corynebacterium sp.]MDO4760894.1 hypothetical protein [Corynebacterium sp.]
MQEEDLKWYFNTKTGEVEQGKSTNFAHRMGPYDTKEQALHALDIARERNRQADAFDEEDDNWDKN